MAVQGREEAAEPRYDEIHRFRGFFQRHEDDEAADDEEQIDAVVASRKRNGRRSAVAVKFVKAGGVVEQHDRQGSHTTQRINLDEPVGSRFLG